jgi:hypothetical protein
MTSEAREWSKIKRFVAACRRHWPGARITIRPDNCLPPPFGASVLRPGELPESWREANADPGKEHPDDF